MGKAGKLRKRRRLENQVKAPILAVHESKSNLADLSSSSSDDKNNKNGGAVQLSQSDINVTVRTLALLAQQTDLYRGKDCRPIRIVVNQLVNNAKGIGLHLGTTLMGKISDALHDHNWAAALQYLAELREKKVVPKLGSLQRWVRDCDAAGGVDGNSYDVQVLRVLDAILRTVDPGQVPQLDDRAPMPSSAEGSEASDASASPLVWHEPFVLRAPGEVDSVARGESLSDPAAYNQDTFKVLVHEKGPERRPPNAFDMILYTSLPDTIQLEADRTEQVTKVPLPGIPGAFLLTDVLSRAECRQIITAAETLGFMPDQPTGDGAASDSVSVLAHNVFWLADAKLNQTIYERCRPLLPNWMGGDGPVVGLNPRWRVFRYKHGSVYRPHVDGAWPASGISADGRYLYDAHNGACWSRMTFLVYLNEDFEGGATTFFLPSKRVGVLDARPVKPRTGCVLLFPHGDTMGSLLHEGSAVKPGGTKYVIRTDLMFMVEKHKEQAKA